MNLPSSSGEGGETPVQLEPAARATPDVGREQQGVFAPLAVAFRVYVLKCNITV
jgi:hypothetical protein